MKKPISFNSKTKEFMNVRNVLTLTLTSLSCLQSYGMEKQIKSPKSSRAQKETSHNTLTTNPLRTNRAKKSITTSPLSLEIKKQLSDTNSYFDPIALSRLLTSNEASKISKEEKMALYDFAKKFKQTVRNNQEDNDTKLDDQLADIIYIEAQEITRALKLFTVLPDLDFPQAIFTNAPSNTPYKNTKLHPDPDEIIAAIIRNEQFKISICCFHLLSDHISKALIHKKKKGVAVELITDQTQGNGKNANKTIKELLNNGIVVLAPQNHKYEQMHHKFFLFKHNVFYKPLMINGSYNPTPHGNLNSWDDVTIENHPKLINQYQTRYAEVKSRSKAVTL